MQPAKLTTVKRSGGSGSPRPPPPRKAGALGWGRACPSGGFGIPFSSSQNIWRRRQLTALMDVNFSPAVVSPTGTGLLEGGRAGPRACHSPELAYRGPLV